MNIFFCCILNNHHREVFGHLRRRGIESHDLKKYSLSFLKDHLKPRFQIFNRLVRFIPLKNFFFFFERLFFNRFLCFSIQLKVLLDLRKFLLNQKIKL